ARIKLAQQGTCLAQAGGDLQTALEPVLALLTPLPAMAAKLGDPIALSQTYGSLGSLYELISQDLTPPGTLAANRWHAEALTLTQQALYAAQPSVLPDVAYPWQWQLARLHQAKGETDLAIRSYRQAVTTLRSVRNNLLPIDSEVQFSFRDNVEPVYRELVDLLLRPDNPSPDTLREAIGLIDTLQLAELESFLQCNLATAEIDEDVIDPTAVNIYSIILPDRLETIIARSGRDNRQRLTRKRHYISQADLEDTLTQLQTNLRSPSGNNRVRRIAGNLYNWMLAPLEAQLDPDGRREDSPVKTLAFILDGSLRNVPMAALFDRQRDRYLLERYAIATVPSLSLVQPEPLPRSMTVLLGGTSEALNHPLQPGNFRPLKNVRKELEAIQPLFKNDLLLDEQFTYPNLKEKLNNNTYTVVHLASHGEFSSDPERTFIMLSQGDGADDSKAALFAKEIDALLRSSSDRVEGIKLLVLSACTTATGDKRATLGMAGLTVRAGSRSTLATLWPVDDASAAALMERFYQELSTDKSLSKAEALRLAQLALPQLGADQNLDWSSPLHWAPYVMVGNWL
ncbi:MAG: CHAT domain-containing protein, partial [Cyanobacteria bacterium P01_H01_bin.58]